LEIADSKEKSDAANFEAQQAEKEAGQANERAANTESNNLVLATKLEELRQPREITIEQTANFMFLTEKIPKIQIGVSVGAVRDETFNFAHQIGQMLEQAGFKRPASHANFLDGIHSDPNMVSYYGFKRSAYKWSDMDFIFNSTNSFYSYKFVVETTNGFNRPIINESAASDKTAIFAALYSCFGQIGITNTSPQCKPDMVSPGDFEIFVLARPQ
jgi:hypothetical protein